MGAGPTGLMAATLLKRRGVGVRIVTERAEASRAFAIQARTLELFQQLGTVDEFLDKGVINPGIDFRVGGLDHHMGGSPDTP